MTIAAAACSSNKGPSNESSTPVTGSPAGGPDQGGTYRTAIEEFGFTGAFDPTGEYLGTAWGLYSDLLLRTLMTYKHVVGLPGDELVPDLAESAPEVSSDGLTYTFHLKSVQFGPPLDRAVTSKDIEYAFRRIDTTALVAQYGFYYDGVIEGMDGPQDKMPADISGIETPDDSTIVFHLQKPTGDLLYRLAMPATAPIPEEVAGCFDKAGDYGRDVISSGPYMIKGEDQLDTTSCDTIKPISGFDPTKRLTIVRNPNYDPSTDSKDDRENNIDGLDIVIDTNTSDIYDKITAGELDGNWTGTPPAEVLQNYLTDPSLKENLHADPGDRTWYIEMNVLAPPFDDVNVRKAVNFAINKAGMLQAAGGPTIAGPIATHIMPPTVLDFGGETYDPYTSPNESGDVQAAKQAMSNSKYDTNHDGTCDASVCNNVLFVNRNIEPFTKYTPIITDNLSSIGIHLKVRELDTGTAYTTIQTVKNLVPIAANAGWGKDYADPSTFAVLFDSSGISCEGQVNYSEIGMDAAKAKECGPDVLAAYNAVKNSVPNVDSEIAKCNALVDQQRTDCWVQFDKDLMETVVPWVPYRWANAVTVTSDSVTKYEFDQFAGAISFCNIAVNNGIDPNTL
jgi:peptide/nickel transport system substrate-binding protein